MTYHTQMEAARMGIVTPEMETVAEKEHIDVNVLRERVAKGMSASLPTSTTRASLPKASAKACRRRST